jgi:hypothetical protein
MELTEINTEKEIINSKRKTNNKLLIKIDSEETPMIFNNINDLYNFIKPEIIFKNNFYCYTIKKINYKITITMNTQKKILNYILTYHTIYDISE